MSKARDITNHRVALQGNMNPEILTLPPEEIISEAKRILQDYGSSDGHIFNLGHGITPEIDPEKVAVLVDTEHMESEIYHQKLTFSQSSPENFSDICFRKLISIFDFFWHFISR